MMETYGVHEDIECRLCCTISHGLAKDGKHRSAMSTAIPSIATYNPESNPPFGSRLHGLSRDVWMTE